MHSIKKNVIVFSYGLNTDAGFYHYDFQSDTIYSLLPNVLNNITTFMYITFKLRFTLAILKPLILIYHMLVYIKVSKNCYPVYLPGNLFNLQYLNKK